MSTTGAFIKGLTLYPFPCIIQNAFKDWSEREFRAYQWGQMSMGVFVGVGLALLVTIALSGCAEAIRGVAGFVAAPVGDWVGTIGNQ